MSKQNQHQIDDQIEWKPQGFIGYPDKPEKGFTGPHDPRIAAASEANRFIKRLIEESRKA